jgi:Co/Zn/Cd efflux system component
MAQEVTFMSKHSLRRTVLTVATLNLIYFAIEFYFGRRFNSISLISDSIDFLEDASINILIALAIGWSLRKRQITSYFLAVILLIPGIAFIWNAISQLLSPEIPEGAGMSFVGLGALVINVTCAIIIARHKNEEGGLVKAAYFSARNDAIANVLIITAGASTVIYPSIIPDLLIGIIIFIMNADAAKAVLKAARSEN